MSVASGTFTFLFTDIEESTRLWNEDRQAMRLALARHDGILREAVEGQRGQVVKMTGDGLLATFGTAVEAIQAAIAAQLGLAAQSWDDTGPLKVRMGLHTGDADAREGDYYGPAVNRAARLTALAAGSQILLSAVSAGLAREGLPDGVSLIDLGAHRLRGFRQAEPVYQLQHPDLESNFPPLKTVAPGPHNLPEQLTSFVGRETQLRDVRELLAPGDDGKDGRTRLVTLTGPGGTGKTRLSIQIASTLLQAFPDGTTFVGLAPIADPALVGSAIAQELGIVEQQGKALSDSLGRYFRDKKALLILDNFEHVLDAAPLVSGLLAMAPYLAILVTSREPLRLSGEHDYTVPPLAVPEVAMEATASQLARTEAVALFVQRARATSSDFQLTAENAQAVADICRRLDGLPLAIELAAARIKLFGPRQMLARLERRLQLLKGGSRDRPDRHRALRDTIDWSYNLLESEEQKLFARLAVFRGGRTLEAVEAVCGPGLDVDVLDGVESLLNKSLLSRSAGPDGEARFVMLELLQEYAGERLAESGEERQLRDNHLTYFVSLAEKMEPGYRRKGGMKLVARTDAELDNLRAAFNWAMESGNLDAAARLLSGVDYYFVYQGSVVEGYRWTGLLLEASSKISKRYRFRFLLAAARMAYSIGNLQQDRELCRQALAIARELKDRAAEAWSLVYLGGSFVEPREGAKEGVKYCEAGVEIFRELNEKAGLAQGLNTLGELVRARGDYQRAMRLYEECLAISTETGEALRQVMTNENLAFVAYHFGDYLRAAELCRETVFQAAGIGWKPGIMGGLSYLAGPLAKLGQAEKAARLLGAAESLIIETGTVYQPGDQHEIARYIAATRERMDDQSFTAAWKEGNSMTTEQAIAYALGEQAA